MFDLRRVKMHTFILRAMFERDRDNIDALLVLVNTWRSSGEQVSLSVYNLLIWTLVEKGRITEAHEWLDLACDSIEQNRAAISPDAQDAETHTLRDETDEDQQRLEVSHKSDDGNALCRESGFGVNMAVSLFSGLLRYHLRHGESAKVQELVARINALKIPGGPSYMFRELLLEAHRQRDFEKMERIAADMQRSGLPLPLETHMLMMKTAYSRLCADKLATRSAKNDMTQFASASIYQQHLQMQRIWRAHIESGQKMNNHMFLMFFAQFRNQFFSRELKSTHPPATSDNATANRDQQSGLATSLSDIIFGTVSPHTHFDGLLVAEASSALSVFLRAGGQFNTDIASEVLHMFLKCGHVRGVNGAIDLSLHWHAPISIGLFKTHIFDMLVDNGALQAACQVLNASIAFDCRTAYLLSCVDSF